jgi:hypothetical protein
MNDFMQRLVLVLGLLGLAASAGLLGASVVETVWGAEPPTRVDLYDTKSNRTGSATVESSGRVDFYDTRGNRTGYGTVTPGGRLDTFDTKSRRTGSGQVTPGGGTPKGGRR